MVPNEDEDVSKELARVFRKRGIETHTGAKVEKVEKTQDGVKVTFTSADGKQVVKEAEKVLVAVGRAPRTADLGLEQNQSRGGARLPPRRRVDADQRSRASLPSATLWPVCPSWPTWPRWRAWWWRPRSPANSARPVRRDRIPACTYCEPQIGSVGLTEAQAKAAGHEVKVGKFPFSANSKASIVGSHEGFIKVVADAKYGELLGVHIIGPQATELVAEAVVALELEATIEESDVHHPCPSHAGGGDAGWLWQRGEHGHQCLTKDRTRVMSPGPSGPAGVRRSARPATAGLRAAPAGSDRRCAAAGRASPGAYPGQKCSSRARGGQQ